MKLTLYRYTEGSPVVFVVRFNLDLGHYSGKTYLNVKRYQVPPFTEIPLEYDPQKPIPEPVLTQEEWEQLTKSLTIKRQFSDVRKAEDYVHRLKQACQETVEYWYRASNFSTDENGETIDFSK